MQKIRPCLWFDSQAEEAMNFYLSVFKRGKALSVNRFDGKVLSVSFELEGQEFIALNGGPIFRFTEAISLFVDCQNQEEVDELWEKLSAGGSKDRCGWLKDRYGLSWQVIPTVLLKLLHDPDPAKSRAVFEAMLKMNRIVIADLRKAYEAQNAA